MSQEILPPANGNAADVRRPAPHPVYWVIAVALSVLAVIEVGRWTSQPSLRLDNAAWAQPALSAGSRGVFAFTGQLTKSTYGVFVVDVDAMTIWTYEYLPQKECLRLAAARTWRYDRYLESHNVCDLTPQAVEKMIEDQRQYRLQSSESQMP